MRCGLLQLLSLCSYSFLVCSGFFFPFTFERHELHCLFSLCHLRRIRSHRHAVPGPVACRPLGHWVLSLWHYQLAAGWGGGRGGCCWQFVGRKEPNYGALGEGVGGIFGKLTFFNTAT